MSIEERRAKRKKRQEMKTIKALLIMALIVFGWSVWMTIDTAKFISHVNAERTTYSHLIDGNEKEL